MSYNYWELFELEKGPYTDWDEHFMKLKKKYNGRINAPNAKKQEEARECIAVLDKKVPTIMAVVLEDPNKIMTSMKVCFELLQYNMLDNNIETIKRAIEGDVDSIIKISKLNLSADTKKEWESIFGTPELFANLKRSELNSKGVEYYNKNDFAKAYELFKQAADMGSIDGIYNVGLCYMNGQGVLVNKSVAKEYFLEAKKLGHTDASRAYDTIVAEEQREASIKENLEKEKKNKTKIVIVIVIFGIVLLLVKGCFSKDKKNDAENIVNSTEKVSEESSTTIEDSSEVEKPKTESPDVYKDVDEKEDYVNIEEVEEIEEPADETKKYLTDMNWFDSSSDKGGLVTYDFAKDNFGNEYTHALGGYTSNNLNWSEYKLGKEYESLDGIVVMNYDFRGETSDDTYLKIYGDDILLYTSPLVTGGMEPDVFSIDVKDVDVLKVSIQGQNFVRLVEAILYKEGAQKSEYFVSENDSADKKMVHLSDFDWFNSSSNKGGLVSYNSAEDNFGTKYSNAIGGYNSKLNWSEYKLDGKYAVLEGRVIMNYDYRGGTSDETYVTIYGDDVLLYTSTLITCGVEPEDFSIDVSGIDVLKICIQGQNYIRIVDAVIKTENDGNRVSSGQKYEFKNQVYLGDLQWYASSNHNGGFKVYNSAKDNYGQNYSNGIGGYDGNNLNWCEYRINGELSNFVGRVVLNGEYAEKEFDDTWVKIYCDNQLIYGSSLVTKGMEPSDFDIDLNGVQNLRIEISGRNAVRMVDCYLNK